VKLKQSANASNKESTRLKEFKTLEAAIERGMYKLR
jgi:hypothetical protein